MTKQKSNKNERATSFPVSLLPTRRQRYKTFAEDEGFNFSSFLCLLYEEDMIAHQEAKNSDDLRLQLHRDKLRVERNKRAQKMGLYVKNK